MKNQGKGNIGKYINLIVLCLIFTFGSACKQKTDNPPTPPCGIGSGAYDFNTVGYPPMTFDCDYEGSFEIYLKPDIHPSYAGFNRLWFELEKDGQVYRSNYVEFYSGDTTTQQLEWGGSLPTEPYEIKGYMKNIQLNSTCEDSIYWEYDHRVGYISITEFSDPEKVMEIEYFCQDSDIDTIDRYDVFLSPNTDEYIDIAFNIANTQANITTYDTDLDAEIVVWDPQRIKEYIADYKQWENEMFLCGVKAFKDTQGYVLPNNLGVTYQEDTIGHVPTCSTGSLVGVKACIDFAAADEYKLDYNDLVTAVVIHELGLQRAVWQLHPLDDPKFCIIKWVFIVYYMNEEHPYWAVTFSNPHFCDECINKIKNVEW